MLLRQRPIDSTRCFKTQIHKLHGELCALTHTYVYTDTSFSLNPETWEERAFQCSKNELGKIWAMRLIYREMWRLYFVWSHPTSIHSVLSRQRTSVLALLSVNSKYFPNPEGYIKSRRNSLGRNKILIEDLTFWCMCNNGYQLFNRDFSNKTCRWSLKIFTPPRQYRSTGLKALVFGRSNLSYSRNLVGSTPKWFPWPPKLRHGQRRPTPALGKQERPREQGASIPMGSRPPSRWFNSIILHVHDQTPHISQQLGQGPA